MSEITSLEKVSIDKKIAKLMLIKEIFTDFMNTVWRCGVLSYDFVEKSFLCKTKVHSFVQNAHLCGSEALEFKRSFFLKPRAKLRTVLRLWEIFPAIDIICSSS
jgi:hypothetical protein